MKISGLYCYRELNRRVLPDKVISMFVTRDNMYDTTKTFVNIERDGEYCSVHERYNHKAEMRCSFMCDEMYNSDEIIIALDLYYEFRLKLKLVV